MSATRTISLLILLAGCAAPTTNPQTAHQSHPIGRVTDKHLTESSGLIASRQYPGILWTHNDGSDAVLFAIHPDGSVIARARINAKIHDWEDITLDDQNHLYISDTGNNDENRKHVTVYRLPEPDPTKLDKSALQPDRTWRLRFPAKPFNGESLFILKDTGYLIAKRKEGQPADLYSFSVTTEDPQDLHHILTLPGIDQPVTAAALNPDASVLALLTREAVYFFNINGEIQNLSKQTPTQVSIPPLKNEGCCFISNTELITIAESGELYSVPVPPVPTTQAH